MPPRSQGLLADIQAARRFTGKPCTMQALREQLSPADRADLDVALADPAISAAAISSALVPRGHDISGGVIQKHRRGQCRRCAEAGTG